MEPTPWVRTRELIQPDELTEHVLHRFAMTGIARLREMRDGASAGALSVGERRLHEVLHNAGLSDWEADVPISVSGRIVTRADVLFPKARLIVEFDGKNFHSDDKDADRDRLLLQAGYRVIHLNWEAVTVYPWQVVAMIRAALTEAAA